MIFAFIHFLYRVVFFGRNTTWELKDLLPIAFLILSLSIHFSSYILFTRIDKMRLHLSSTNLNRQCSFICAANVSSLRHYYCKSYLHYFYNTLLFTKLTIYYVNSNVVVHNLLKYHSSASNYYFKSIAHISDVAIADKAIVPLQFNLSAANISPSVSWQIWT